MEWELEEEEEAWKWRKRKVVVSRFKNVDLYEEKNVGTDFGTEGREEELNYALSGQPLLQQQVYAFHFRVVSSFQMPPF